MTGDSKPRSAVVQPRFDEPFALVAGVSAAATMRFRPRVSEHSATLPARPKNSAIASPLLRCSFDICLCKLYWSRLFETLRSCKVHGFLQRASRSLALHDVQRQGSAEPPFDCLEPASMGSSCKLYVPSHRARGR